MKKDTAVGLLVVLLAILIPTLVGFTLFGPPGNVSTEPVVTTGSILWPNATVMLKARDSGGTAQEILKTDVGNFTYLRSAGLGVLLQEPDGETHLVCIDDAACQFQAVPSTSAACATGFTRIGINYCRSDGVTSQAWADAVACTARTTGSSLPASAKMANVRIEWSVLSNNAIANRNNSAVFYDTTTCIGVPTASTSVLLREFAAVAAGTQLILASDHVIAPLPAADTFYTTQGNAGGNGNGDIVSSIIEGYWE